MLEKISRDTFASAYEALLRNVLQYPDYKSAPRGKKIHESMNVTYTLRYPMSNLFKNEVRSVPMDYLKGELLWYYSGDNKIDYITKYSKFWNHITNPDKKTVNSAYGHLIFEMKNKSDLTSWDWAKNSLINDIDTRQALLHFNRPEHAFHGNKDFVCTLNGLFSIRENKLNFTITQRSCDMIRGLTFDTPFFTTLQYFMWKELLTVFPKLELGTFTHFINSLHIYEEHFDLVSDMLDNEFIEDDIPTPDIDLGFLRGASYAIVNDRHVDREILRELYTEKSTFMGWLLDNNIEK